MTENSSGENNIESLAQRAKEVLDRVRANADGHAAQIETETPAPELDESVEIDDSAEVETAAAVATTERRDQVEVEESAKVEEPVEIDESAEVETAAAVATTERRDQVEVEESAKVEEPVEIDESAEAQVEADAAGAIGVEPAPVDDENDRRAIGWLIPIILLALVVLALIIFGGDLFGSSDDDDTPLAGSDETTITTITDPAPETTESTTTEPDTTSTESTSSTTTTTEAPPAQPATAWDLLGEASKTNEFASFAGPLGLQALLESAPIDGESEGFTLLAPSDEAMAALSQEQLAALSLDPAAAQALVDYHVVNGRLTQDLLREAAGGQIQSTVGLPITVVLDGDGVLLNGTVPLSSTTLESLNGNVIVIDSVLEPPTINSVINLGDVQFEVISAIITPQGQAELQKAVTFFVDNPDANAVIQGHTDTDGPSEPNQRLSQRRAQAVRDYLISQGIDGARLEAEGFGESQPIVVDGVEDKAASRRIEFVLR